MKLLDTPLPLMTCNEITEMKIFDSSIFRNALLGNIRPHHTEDL